MNTLPLSIDNYHRYYIPCNYSNLVIITHVTERVHARAPIAHAYTSVVSVRYFVS